MDHHCKNKISGTGKEGFTLIEALVAFSILAIAFGAFSSSFTTGIKAFKHAESSHLASKMAKEGMELVINKKQNHSRCYADGECLNWRDNLSVGSYEVSSVRPDDLLPGRTLREFDPSRPICFMDEFSSGKGKFGYCSGPGDLDGEGDIVGGYFTREIVIESLGEGMGEDDPDGIRVRSIVRWGGSPTDQQNKVELETFLYGI